MPKSSGHRERLLTPEEQGEQRRLFTIALPQSWRESIERTAARRKIAQADVLIELLAPGIARLKGRAGISVTE